MPFVSQAQRRYMFARHPQIAKEFAAKTPKGARLPEHVRGKKKKKPIIGVDNKMKGSYGETTLQKGKRPIIKINVKKHKGDKAELADTIKHEMYHAKHPKATEKTTYKAMPKTISHEEQERLISKLRGKKINYKVGAAKRKLGISRRQKTEPGSLIRAMNERKQKRTITKAISSRERVALMGIG